MFPAAEQKPRLPSEPTNGAVVDSKVTHRPVAKGVSTKIADVVTSFLACTVWVYLTVFGEDYTDPARHKKSGINQ